MGAGQPDERPQPAPAAPAVNDRAVEQAGPVPESGPRPEPAQAVVEETADRLTVRAFAREFVQTFGRIGVTALASQVAYSLMFAIFPIFLLIMSLAALIDRYLEIPLASHLQTMIDDQAPDPLKPVLRELVDGAIARVSGIDASLRALVAVVLALWGGSGGVGALVNACNRAFGVKNVRPLLVRQLMTLGLTLVMAALIVASAGLFLFGETIARELIELVSAGPRLSVALRLTRWALAIGLTMISLGTLYYLGPSVEQSVVWVIPGAAFAALIWLLILSLFSAALRITNPGNPYGAAGSVIMLLWFFYLTGLVFILGALVNAVLGRRFDRRRLADLERHPEKRLFTPTGQER